MKNIFIVAIGFAAIFILSITDFGRPNGVVYDCRDAHWHPDIPVEVKQECARIKKEEWERIHKDEQTKKLLIYT